jgi:hypothetical protein
MGCLHFHMNQQDRAHLLMESGVAAYTERRVFGARKYEVGKPGVGHEEPGALHSENL